MGCPACGQRLDTGARFCGRCGRRQTTQLRERGRTIAEQLALELVDWRRACEIWLATCDAVGVARARGADRLSLEPSSFYLEVGAEGLVVTVLDAAPPTPDEPHDTEVMPRPPLPVGVPGIEYFSPEKLMGKPLDAASDVYTLGVIGYQLVTGQLPFPDAHGPAGLITAQLKQVPATPSTIRPDAAIPAAVDAVLRTCLDKERGKRPVNALVLADAIAHILATEAVLPPRVEHRTPPPPPRKRKFQPPPAAITILAGRTCGSPTCKTRHAFRGGPEQTVLGSWLYLDHFDSLVSRRPVNAHPHAGVAALCYLFEGRIVHRDSLGNEQHVPPHAISWFHAGRGALHADRRDPADAGRLHGIELWSVLPRPNEDDPPAYTFRRPRELPSVVISGARVRVVLGAGFGEVSPLETATPLSLFDIRLPAKARVPLPMPQHKSYQRAVYVVSGAVEVYGAIIEARQLAVIQPGLAAGVVALRDAPAHVVVLGSPPVIGTRYSRWYFTSSSKAHLAELERRYAAGGFGTIAGEPAPPLPKG